MAWNSQSQEVSCENYSRVVGHSGIYPLLLASAAAAQIDYRVRFLGEICTAGSDLFIRTPGQVFESVNVWGRPSRVSWVRFYWINYEIKDLAVLLCWLAGRIACPLSHIIFTTYVRCCCWPAIFIRSHHHPVHWPFLGRRSRCPSSSAVYLHLFGHPKEGVRSELSRHGCYQTNWIIMGLRRNKGGTTIWLLW